MHRWTRAFSIAVLAVLIVMNVLLLFLLFRPDEALIARPANHDPGDGGSPTMTSSPATTSSASPPRDQTASASRGASTDPTPSTPKVESVPVERLLLAISSNIAWRATVGDCNTPGEIERSTDGGTSWERIVRTGPAPIVSLGIEPSGEIFTIGGTRGSCSVRYLAYANDGAVTGSATNTVNEWFPSPNDRDEINGPGETKATPCNRHVIGLAPFDLTRALVVCDNGDVINSRNSGKTWRLKARIPNTLAVAAGSGQYWVAGVRKECDGVSVQSLTEKKGNLTSGRTRCAPGLGGASGQVAIDVSGTTIWLWSGKKVAISTDEGETWK
jgi:hypothetical protein